jgi:Tfp pilus assembly protein PilO
VQTVYKKYITISILIWSISFVLFVLAYMLVLGPQKTELDEIKQKLAQRDADFAKVVDAETGITKERLNKELAGLHSKIDDFVSVGGDSSKLVVDIGQVANELRVTSFSSKGSQNEQSRAILPMCKVLGIDYFYISFKGSFGQFARFINAMERYKPVLFVDRFSITRSDNGSVDNDINIVLAVFVCPQNGAGSSALLAGP